MLLETGGSTGGGPAQACFRKAIEIGHAQGALSLELRAALSLAHLLRKQRKAREA